MYAIELFNDEDILFSSLKRKNDKYLEPLLNCKHDEYKVLTHTIKAQRNKKILSFSVYGTKEIYYAGAETNIDRAEKVYPSWTCRFYCTEEVPIERIRQTNSAGQSSSAAYCTSRQSPFLLV